MLWYYDRIDDDSYVLCSAPEEEDKDYILWWVSQNYPEYLLIGGDPVVYIDFINPFTEREVEVEIDLREWV